MVTNPIHSSFASVMTSRLSLWLTPASGSANEKGWIQASKEAVSMVRSTMSPIMPHVTLASWAEPFPEVSLDEIAKQAPFRLKPFPSVQTSETFWMCIFVEMSPSTSLSRLRDFAQAIRSDIRPGPYRPHASLVYGKVDLQTKIMVARAMDCFSPPSFACERICLVDTSDEDHTKWKIIAETNLKGSSDSKPIAEVSTTK